MRKLLVTSLLLVGAALFSSCGGNDATDGVDPGLTTAPSASASSAAPSASASTAATIAATAPAVSGRGELIGQVTFNWRDRSYALAVPHCVTPAVDRSYDFIELSGPVTSTNGGEPGRFRFYVPGVHAPGTYTAKDNKFAISWYPDDRTKPSFDEQADTAGTTASTTLADLNSGTFEFKNAKIGDVAGTFNCG